MSGAPAGIPGYEGLNEGQYTIATRFDKRLFVSAGAGSGKTFSLTQRVIRALEEGSAPDGGCVLGSICLVRSFLGRLLFIDTHRLVML